MQEIRGSYLGRHGQGAQGTDYRSFLVFSLFFREPRSDCHAVMGGLMVWDSWVPVLCEKSHLYLRLRAAQVIVLQTGRAECASCLTKLGAMCDRSGWAKKLCNQKEDHDRSINVSQAHGL